MRIVKTRLCLGLLLALLMIPVSRSLAEVDLWVCDGRAGLESNAQAKPISAVNWHQSSNGYYYLFLPSCFDTESMRLCFSGAESLVCGSESLASGGGTDFLVPGGRSVVIKKDRQEYKVVTMQSANIAAMFISTDSGTVGYIHESKDNEEKGSLLMKDPGGAVIYNGALRQIRIRGNSTAQYNKKPYQIKLEEKTALIDGRAVSRTWVLLANVIDKSLLRNTVALGLARAAGIRYTPATMPVDLYINNAYMGSYLLCEKAEVGEGRVNIEDLEKKTEALNSLPLEEYPVFGTFKYAPGASHGYLIENDPEDITGGYLLMTELYTRFDSEDSMVVTDRGQPVCIKSPQYASLAQTDYVRALVQSAENAIFAQDGVDPDSGSYYTEIFDLDSMVLKYLLDEVVVNFDAANCGSYFVKHPDSVSNLLFCCPAWDYDNCMGVIKDANITGYRWIKKLDRSNSYYWLTALSDHEDFEAALKAAYNSVYLPLINALLGIAPDPASRIQAIDDYASEIRASAGMNQRRWPVRYESFSEKVQNTGADFDSNVEFLRGFLAKHTAYLTSVWGSVDAPTGMD